MKIAISTDNGQVSAHFGRCPEFTVVEIENGKVLSKEVIAQESRWRSFLDHVQLLIVELDHQGNVSYVNPYFLELTGYTKEEVEGKHWCTHFVPENEQQNVHEVVEEIYGLCLAGQCA